MSAQLSHVEQLTARMFYNVSVQSAFALEDPNVRFVVEFQQKDQAGLQGASKMADVKHQVYQTEVTDGRAAFEVRPENSPALSRVLMWGGDAKKVVDAVVDGCKQAENFSVNELGALPPAAGREIPPGASNRFLHLVIDPKFNSAHDVAALFAWNTLSDTEQPTLELMAWPIMKNAEAKQ